MKEPVTHPHAAAHPTAHHPDVAAKEPEATPPQRLDAFIAGLQHIVKHGGGVTASHVRELKEIAAHLRGDKDTPVELHEFAKPSLVPQPDKILIMVSAEEALQHVRGLPDEDRNLPHWQAAERALLSAIDTGERLDAAQSAFDAAVVENRKLHPAKVAGFEKLPDGRLREDRFADRRLVPEAKPAVA